MYSYEINITSEDRYCESDFLDRTSFSFSIDAESRDEADDECCEFIGKLDKYAAGLIQELESEVVALPQPRLPMDKYVRICGMKGRIVGWTDDGDWPGTAYLIETDAGASAVVQYTPQVIAFADENASDEAKAYVGKAFGNLQNKMIANMKTGKRKSDRSVACFT